jgi:hypothetical protein
MSDPKNATITLVNAEKLIYITKYKSEIDLMILDDFSSNYEDIMYVA